MKPLGLDFASIVLEMKNKGKCFWTFETHQKGKAALKRLLFEPPTVQYT